MKLSHIHPFPARMAPELALAALMDLPANALVLDPMVGSGTVLRHASFAGYKSIGFDVDPLAVLVSRVSSRKIDIEEVELLYEEIMDMVAQTRLQDIDLPWMDSCEETTRFVAFWFGKNQRNGLRKLAHALWQAECHSVGPEKYHVDVLKVALSRIIITKENGASLARDVSHSRPHKVRNSSDYDVVDGFRRSVAQVVRFLEDGLPIQNAIAKCGDARNLKNVRESSVDIVITSPPYLNAIDYLRGHKLSLVWFGYTIDQIRKIRSDGIGSERVLRERDDSERLQVEFAMIDPTKLSARHRGIVSRYAADVLLMIAEIARVLKSTGRAVLVVGDCCVRSEFVSNSAGIERAAQIH